MHPRREHWRLRRQQVFSRLLFLKQQATLSVGNDGTCKQKEENETLEHTPSISLRLAVAEENGYTDKSDERVWSGNQTRKTVPLPTTLRRATRP